MTTDEKPESTPPRNPVPAMRRITAHIAVVGDDQLMADWVEVTDAMAWSAAEIVRQDGMNAMVASKAKGS